MRKGQAAMEFLMTYGWAILVVLVAIGALAYFGVLSPSQFLPEKCTISTGSGLFCKDHQADSDASQRITLKIQNILTETVTIAIGDAKVVFTKGASTITCTNTAAFSPTADGEVDLLLPCNTDFEVGDKIKGDITITYTPTGGLKKTTTGQLVTVAADMA